MHVLTHFMSRSRNLSLPEGRPLLLSRNWTSSSITRVPASVFSKPSRRLLPRNTMPLLPQSRTKPLLFREHRLHRRRPLRRRLQQHLPHKSCHPHRLTQRKLPGRPHLPCGRLPTRRNRLHLPPGGPLIPPIRLRRRPNAPPTLTGSSRTAAVSPQKLQTR